MEVDTSPLIDVVCPWALNDDFNQASGPRDMVIMSQRASSRCRKESFVLPNISADYIEYFLVGDMVRVWNEQDVTVAYHLHRLVVSYNDLIVLI